MRLPAYYTNTLDPELLKDYTVAIDILLSNKDEYDRLKAQFYWAKVWLRLSRREEAEQRLAREHFENGGE